MLKSTYNWRDRAFRSALNVCELLELICQKHIQTKEPQQRREKYGCCEYAWTWRLHIYNLEWFLNCNWNTSDPFHTLFSFWACNSVKFRSYLPGLCSTFSYITISLSTIILSRKTSQPYLEDRRRELTG